MRTAMIGSRQQRMLLRLLRFQGRDLFVGQAENPQPVAHRRQYDLP